MQIIFPANSLHIANLSGLPSIRSSTLLNGDAGNESISLARENGKRSTNREINPSAIPRQISSPSSKEREEESNTLREARENSSSIRSGFREEEEIGIERCLLVGGPDASSLSLRPPFEPRECMSRTISLNSIKPRGKRFFPSFSRSSPPPPEILCGLGDLLPILPRGDILSGIEKLCDRMIATLGETRYVEGREKNGADNRGNEIDPRDLRRV